MLTCAIQRVGYDHDQTDDHGATSLNEFLALIDDFPWDVQHREWDREQSGPFPAVVLRHAERERQLWVTRLGDSVADAGAYQLQSVRMVERKSLFGKRTREQHAQVIDVDSRDDVELLCRLFCEGRHDELDSQVARFA